MKPRNTLIVVAVFAVLVGYLYFFEINKTPEQLSAQLGTPTARPPVYALQFNSSEVASIQVSDLQAPRQVVIKRNGDQWQIAQPADKAADTFPVQSAVSALSSLQASRVLTDVTDLAPYGLVTPTLEVRLVMSDTKQYAITVGGKTPNGASYYVTYTGDKSRVFLVNTGSIDEVKAWLDTPPYQPTPTPTFTPSPTPSVTDTPAVTPTPPAAETPKP
ncbi:MAG: DUF4340 domain-containing protein [Chloroflexi bacterium]|nr:DUF4340 domain-containing protein [Chloroflexota bacterium]